MSIKVSVITCTFNSEATILETIESVGNQTFPNIEHIIIDGGSSDRTLELCAGYSGRQKLVVSEPDDGIYDAFNKGIAASTGDIISILNSDDIYVTDDVIQDVVSAFQKNDAEIVYGDVFIVGQYDETKILREWKSSEYETGSMQKGWHPPHPSLFVKRTTYMEHGTYTVDFKVSADFDMMLRLFEVNKVPSFYLSGNLVRMRAGGRSSTVSGIISGNKDVIRAFKRNGIKVNPFIYLSRRILPKVINRIKTIWATGLGR